MNSGDPVAASQAMGAEHNTKKKGSSLDPECRLDYVVSLSLQASWTSLYLEAGPHTSFDRHIVNITVKV